MPTMSFTANDFRPAGLEPGSYKMAIEAMEETVSRNTQKPMIKITYSCVHEGFEGRKAWQYIVFPEGRFQLGRLLLATGLFTEDDLVGKDVNFEYADLIGQRVGVVLVPTVYNGQPSTQVDRAIPEDEATGPSGESLPSMPTAAPSRGMGGSLM